MENIFNVPKKQWNKWSPLSKAVFNDLYYMMLNNFTLFNHPDAIEIEEEWYTVCWNAAWLAAEMIKDNRVYSNER